MNNREEYDQLISMVVMGFAVVGALCAGGEWLARNGFFN